MVAARSGCGLAIRRGQRGGTVAEDALGVGSGERQAGEELGRHAATPTGIELPARRAGAGALGLAKPPEQLRLTPDANEPTGGAYVAGPELVVDGERAGVDVADGVHQADHPSRAAQVEPG